jgi:hypothetical protein
VDALRIKMILEKRNVGFVYWSQLASAFCEHGNERSGSINARGFF